MRRQLAAGVLVVGALAASCANGSDDSIAEDLVTLETQRAPTPTVDTTEPASRAGEDTADPNEQAALAAGQRFLDTYVAPHGRVVRHDHGGDTVSEGQAYAMLVAVALDDEDHFASVWAWTSDHLQRPDGLLSWRWDGGSVVDAQPATDADLDTVHALLLAAERFDEPSYADDARRLTDAIYDHLTVPLDAGRLLLPGLWAVDEMVWNPSYNSPLAFSILYRLGGDHRWAEVAATGRLMLDRLTAHPPHLPPDWATYGPDGPRPRGDAPVYGYDAVRTPWRLALDCDDHGVSLAARSWPILAEATGHGDHAPMAILDLNGAPRTDGGHPAATVGAAAAAAAAGDRDASRRLLALAEGQDVAQPTYYGSALIALGRLGLETDLLGSCR
jgi:endoglucanase